jgi:hypothetical protein
VAARALPKRDTLQPLLLDITCPTRCGLICGHGWKLPRAQGDAFYRSVGEQFWRGFLAWGEGQIDSPTEQQREADAARLPIMAEGAMLLQSIGMDDVKRKL